MPIANCAPRNHRCDKLPSFIINPNETIPITNMISKTVSARRKTWLKNPRALVRPSRPITSLKVGTSALFKAPSPKSRRNKLGNVNATMKAELQMLVPKAAKIIASRTNPSNLDPRVVLLTVAIFLKLWSISNLLNIQNKTKSNKALAIVYLLI